jgi:hypothetical protein
MPGQAPRKQKIWQWSSLTTLLYRVAQELIALLDPDGDRCTGLRFPALSLELLYGRDHG